MNMSEKLKLIRPELSKSSERPLVISGPCSANRKNRLWQLLMNLPKWGLVFSGQVFGNHEPGPIALRGWVHRLYHGYRSEKGDWMLTATEVANVWHVKECLRHNIDVLWIGARTTANPFTMQEIADSLRGLDVIVFVKNPVNPDLELWIGALERLNKAGITKLVAVHRGFSVYGHNDFETLLNGKFRLNSKEGFLICQLLPIQATSAVQGVSVQHSAESNGP